MTDVVTIARRLPNLRVCDDNYGEFVNRITPLIEGEDPRVIAHAIWDAINDGMRRSADIPTLQQAAEICELKRRIDVCERTEQTK